VNNGVINNTDRIPGLIKSGGNKISVGKIWDSDSNYQKGGGALPKRRFEVKGVQERDLFRFRSQK